MDTLIAIGAGAAWAYSLPGVLRPAPPRLFRIGRRYPRLRARRPLHGRKGQGRASEAIRKLIELQPDTAMRVCATASSRNVAIDDSWSATRLRVRPGDKVPTDGVVVEGGSAIDESLLTGESLPVAKGPGDAVVGGCLNGNGAFVMSVTAVGGDTVLSGIIRMVDHAQGTKLPVQKLADRISARFVPAVGAIAATTLAGWLLAGHPASRGAGPLGGRAADRLPLRARPGHAHRDHGRHRPGGQARHLHPQRRSAGNRRQAHHAGLRQDRHHHRRAAGGHRLPGPAPARTRP